MSYIVTKAIVTAMPDEAELIIEKYALKEVKKKGSMTIYEGEISSDDTEKENLVLVLCGVGKIHATFATTYLFENYSPEKIINI